MKRIDNLEKEVSELNAKVEELLHRTRVHVAASTLNAYEIKKRLDYKKFKKQLKEYF
jgi:outer membrane murein-binding lipoprotein Lpp